jgi:hypothetical protein
LLPRIYNTTIAERARFRFVSSACEAFSSIAFSESAL